MSKNIRESEGQLIILTGASGAGKDAVMNEIIGRTGWKRVITCCAGRPIRRGEQNGVDYHFLEVEEFKSGIAKNIFLEYYRYGETFKGTRKGELLEAKEQVVIWRIDPETAAGAKELLRSKGLEQIADRSVRVYIGVPSIRTLFERQIKREPETPKEVILDRIKLDWKVWRENSNRYDLVVINEEGKLNETVNSILTKIRK